MNENSLSYALSQIYPSQANYGFAPPQMNYGFTPTSSSVSTGTGLTMPTISTAGGSSSLGLNPSASGLGLEYGGQKANPNLNLNQGNGFGFNMPTMQLGLQGLAAIGNLYLGSKALGMSKDQFNFSKQMAQTNLKNQVNAYNTGLEDRLRTREQFNTGASGDAWRSDFERLRATT